MALTITISRTAVAGNARVSWGTMTFDSSYPTNGEAWTTDRAFGMGTVENLSVQPKSGYVFEPDYTNKKIKAFCSVNVMNGTQTNNQITWTSAGVFQSAINPSSADISYSGKEVVNATDLSSVTARWVAFGY